MLQESCDDNGNYTVLFGYFVKWVFGETPNTISGSRSCCI